MRFARSTWHGAAIAFDARSGAIGRRRLAKSMKSTRRQMSRFFVLFAALAISSCGSIHVGAENETDIRVIDLKIPAAGPFGWIDNETFVVMTHTGERYTRKDGADVLVARVTTLNYRTGERKLYGKVSSELCFADGYISYAFLDRATDDLWMSYGELGKETVRKVKPGEMAFDRGPRGSCRPWNERPRNPPWATEKKAIWHLSPPMGFLNCDVPAATLSTKHVKARFHKPNDEIGVELPFSCYEASRSLRYYPFKGAYFVLEFDFRSPWPEGRDRSVFWLYPDGRVEAQVLPYSQAIRSDAIPTARGLIAFSRPANRDDDYWIYLVTPQTTERVLRGSAAGVTSPDGCKVAMLHDADFKARVRTRGVDTPVTLKILELCEKK
jgi:hypothetical protein